MERFIEAPRAANGARPAKGPNGIACESCRHFAKADGPGDEGACRAHPPAMTYLKVTKHGGLPDGSTLSEEQLTGMLSNFPPTRTWQWCGEHAPVVSG